MKKLILFLAIFLLSGCFNGEKLSSNGSLSFYENETITIFYPIGWDIFEKEALQQAPDGTIVVFRSPESVGGIFPNISVVSEEISENMDNLTFAQANIERAEKSLVNLQTIKQEKIEINGKKVVLFNFLGRLSDSEQDYEYWQAFFTKGDLGVVITAILSTDIDDADQEIVKSVIQTLQIK